MELRNNTRRQKDWNKNIAGRNIVDKILRWIKNGRQPFEFDRVIFWVRLFLGVVFLGSVLENRIVV